MNVKTTRREILGAAGLAVWTARRAAAEPAAAMRFGFTTYQWGREWDIPALIANSARAGAEGVELRTELRHAHGVELDLDPAQRREVKKRFAGSALKLVGLATSVRFDSPDPAVLKKNIADGIAFARLSHDVGGSGIRVFPNDFHQDVPEEKTIAQIAAGVDELGRAAADFGQAIRLENHGSAGRLVTLAKVMQGVRARNVRIKLNCDPRDSQGGTLPENFALVKGYLDDTLHLHELTDTRFPYQLQMKLLAQMGWKGWCLMEASRPAPDLVAAMREQRRLWDQLVAAA